MIPLKINGKQLIDIFNPTLAAGKNDAQKRELSLQNLMYPTSVENTSETYSRDAERTADFELSYLLLVNRKASPSFTWQLIPAVYVERLLAFLKYAYDFKNVEGVVVPREAPSIQIEYYDFVGIRIIDAYLGQTIEGTLVEHPDGLFWEGFRIAFPER